MSLLVYVSYGLCWSERSSRPVRPTSDIGHWTLIFEAGDGRFASADADEGEDDDPKS